MMEGTTRMPVINRIAEIHLRGPALSDGGRGPHRSGTLGLLRGGDDPVRVVAVPALCSRGTRPDPSPSAPRSECDTGSRGLVGRIGLAAWVHSEAGWAGGLGGHPESHPA